MKDKAILQKVEPSGGLLSKVDAADRLKRECETFSVNNVLEGLLW